MDTNDNYVFNPGPAFAPSLTTSLAATQPPVRKLGRVRPAAPPQCLRLGSYLGAPTVPPPKELDYYTKAAKAIKHMYLNDQFGCCVISDCAHAVGVWSANDAATEGGSTVIATDFEVLTAYQQICGPGDNGCNVASVLDYKRTRGIKFGGQVHKIDGYVVVDFRNKIEVQVALYLFGTLTIGLNLPKDWLESPENGVWIPTRSAIQGGHDVMGVGYNDHGVVISTWGGLRLIRWDAFTSTQWLDESYVQLAPLWYGNDNLAPNGIDVTMLKADLAKLKGGFIPDLPPVGPTPQPAPQPPAVFDAEQFWTWAFAACAALIAGKPVPPFPGVTK